MPRPSSTRIIVFYSLMTALVITSMLLLTELMLRLFTHVRVRSIHTASQHIFHRIPGVFEPRQDVAVQARPELAHRVSINSLGYRGREIGRTKRPNTVRILCLGDSFTFGDYVNDDETFPHYLQELFDQKQVPVEVINGGVGGTTIVDHFWLLKKSVEIGSDLVILTFSENDIKDLGRWEPMHVSLEKNRRLKSAPIVGSVYRLVRDTALFNFALLVKANYENRFRVERGDPEEIGSGKNSQDNEEVLWKKYEELLGAMRTYLEERSTQLMFAIFPSHYRFAEEVDQKRPPDDRLDRVEKTARNLGIVTINLLGRLRSTKLDRNELYLFPHDGHPSKIGYSIMASELFHSQQLKFLLSKVMDKRAQLGAVTAQPSPFDHHKGERFRQL